MSDKKKPRLSIAERAEGLRKRADEQKNVTNLVTTLQQVNPDNTSPKNAISILVAKFGYPAFEQALELERSVPMTMPDSMRESLLLKFATDCGLQNFQDIHCVVKSFPELIKVNSDPANVRVLVPPTDICLRGCTDLSGNPGKLTIHDPAKDVTYHSLAGTSTKKKVTLRCRKCNTNYGFAMYGDSVTGYRFYTEERFAVEASNCTYIDRRLYNFQLSLSLHAWVSFSAFSESYKDALTGVAEGLGRKTVSAAFFWGEVEMELRRLHLVDTFVFKTKSFEEALDIIEEHRQKSIYPHADADCTPDCKKRGCGRLYVADGIWKLVFTHCMMRTENVVAGIPLLGYPDVCTNELRPGHAFCEEHCQVMESLQIKTKLREFLASCGLSEKEATQAESGQLCEESLRKVKDKISALAKSHGDLGKAGSPPIKSQVGTDFVKDHPQAVSEASSSEVQGTEACNKDTGQHKSLNMLSRGHLVIVGGGGIISKFDPIYRAESPSQVFLIFLIFLYTLFKNMPQAAWSNIWLSYDNMCNVARLKVAKKDLKCIPKPFDKMWSAVNKMIDGLHIKNHKNPNCKTDFGPQRLGEQHEDLKESKNSMAAEQTFVWMGRYKKILISMPKSHHLFYLHRMIIRRNEYTVRCYKAGLKPVIPGGKS